MSNFTGSPENLNVEATSDELVISATKVEGEEDLQRRIARRAFRKSFKNPNGIYDFQKLQVSYNHGILNIQIPKSAKAKPTQFQINIGKSKLLNS